MNSTDDWQEHVITAGQLQAMLEAVQPDTPVVMGKDAEGNSYSPLASVITEGHVYEPDSTWAGTVYTTEPDPEDPDHYVPEDGTPVVLLWPVN